MVGLEIRTPGVFCLMATGESPAVGDHSENCETPAVITVAIIKSLQNLWKMHNLLPTS